MGEMDRHGEAGFTLVELMIVMVALGILGGIALLAVTNIQSDAISTKAESNLKMCETAKTASAVKHGDESRWGDYLESSATC